MSVTGLVNNVRMSASRWSGWSMITYIHFVWVDRLFANLWPCRRKTFTVHQTFVWWILYIPYKFVKSPIRHLGLAIGNVRRVRRFSPTLWLRVWQLRLRGYCVSNHLSGRPDLQFHKFYFLYSWLLETGNINATNTKGLHVKNNHFFRASLSLLSPYLTLSR